MDIRQREQDEQEVARVIEQTEQSRKCLLPRHCGSVAQSGEGWTQIKRKHVAYLNNFLSLSKISIS